MSLGKLPFFNAGIVLRDAEYCALDIIRWKDIGLKSFQFNYLFDAYCLHMFSFWEILEKEQYLNQESVDIFEQFKKQRHDSSSPLFYIKTARNQLVHEGPILFNSAFDQVENKYPCIDFDMETSTLPSQLYSSIVLPSFSMFAGISLSLKPVTDHWSFKKLGNDVPVPMKDNGDFMNPIELVEMTYHMHGEMFTRLITASRKGE